MAKPIARILVIHGAGMNMRGKLQIPVFGPTTLPEYEAKISEYAKELNVEVAFYHSNIEGEIANKLYEAWESKQFQGIVLNPAAFTVGYRFLVNAVAAVNDDSKGIPIVEVHFTQLQKRSIVSDISASVHATITGCGVFSYKLAFETLLNAVSTKK